MAAIRNGTEHVGAKMKEKITTPVGPGMIGTGLIERLQHSGHQYKIGPRTVEEEKQLSEGGFAFVWMVRDTRNDEEFALKKILCQDKANIAMARREVEILERLPVHPNLVKYHGHTTEKACGNAKEVMLLFELCPGGHLLDLLEMHQGKLSEAKILSVFTDVCTAVNVLHTRSPPVQHRDLKVENILLGADGKWKLCDFGSWSDEVCNPALMDKQQVSKLTEQIDKYTTMMYRPPEMVDLYQQFEISIKVDIWMLGCILFTLMFCRHPFQDESTLAISNARYDIPNEPAFPENFRDLTRWCLARNPMNRPHIKEICDILANFDTCGPLVLPQEVIDQKERHQRLYADAPSRHTNTKKDRGDRKLAKEGRHTSTPRHSRSSSKSQRSFRPEARHGRVASWGIGEKVEWPSSNAAPVVVPQPTAWCDFSEPKRTVSSSSSSRKQNEILSHSWPSEAHGTWPQTSHQRTPSGSTAAADDWDPFGNSPGTSPEVKPQPGVEQSWHAAASWPSSIFSQSSEVKAPDRGAVDPHPWNHIPVAQRSSGPEARPWSHVAAEAPARHGASPSWPFVDDAEPDRLVRANTAPIVSIEPQDWRLTSRETEPTSPVSPQINGVNRRQEGTPQPRSPWDPLLSASNGTGGVTAVETLAASTQALWMNQEDPYEWLTPRPAPKVL